MPVRALSTWSYSLPRCNSMRVHGAGEALLHASGHRFEPLHHLAIPG
ncbi:MAG TPA: hypothetical protein VNV39_07640 [Stellaceae bacterium]|jgi:hypothetical protein|nr:hypothetical protein [Stellaceae bacterium]